MQLDDQPHIPAASSPGSEFLLPTEQTDEFQILSESFWVHNIFFFALQLIKIRFAVVQSIAQSLHRSTVPCFHIKIFDISHYHHKRNRILNIRLYMDDS
jgi:hypothetical protein